MESGVHVGAGRHFVEAERAAFPEENGWNGELNGNHARAWCIKRKLLECFPLFIASKVILINQGCITKFFKFH